MLVHSLSGLNHPKKKHRNLAIYTHIKQESKGEKGFSGYLQQVCVNELRAPQARRLVELRLKQNGNVLGGGGLLIG